MNTCQITNVAPPPLAQKLAKGLAFIVLLVLGSAPSADAQNHPTQALQSSVSDSISGLEVVISPSVVYEPLGAVNSLSNDNVNFTVSYKNKNDMSPTKATRIHIKPLPEKGKGFADFGFVRGQLKDALAPDAQFVIPAGQTSASYRLPIRVTSDGLSEGSELARFQVRAISATNPNERNVLCNGSVCESIASLQVVDPDSINISIGPVNLTENSFNQQNVRVTAAWASGNARPESTNILLEIAGTATFGSDYQMTAAGVLTIPSTGNPYITIPIPANKKAGNVGIQIRVINDALDEESESIEFRARSSNGYPNGKSIRGITPAQLTISDDDTAGIVFETGSLGPIEINEGSNAQYFVRLNSQPASKVTITINKSADSDIIVSPSSLTFTTTDYSEAQTVTVQTVVDDDVIDKTATIVHSAVSDDAKYNLINGNVKVQQTDTDEAEFYQPVSDIQIPEGLNDYYEIGLLQKPQDDVMVDVTVTGANTVSVQTSVFTFTPENWNVRQRVEVRTIADSDRLNSVATISHVVRSSDSAFAGLTIQDVVVTSTEPTRLIDLSLDISKVSENSALTTITVTATRLGGNFDEFLFSVVVGAAGSTASAGADYKQVPAFRMAIPAGAKTAQKRFAIDVIDDKIDEDAKEQVTIAGHAVSSVQQTIFQNAILSIVDDDTLSNVLTIKPSITKVSEAVGTAVLTLDIAWKGEVTSNIDWQILLAVQDGTAELVADYGVIIAARGELRLPAESASITTQQVIIKIIDDSLDEDNETIKLSALAVEVPDPNSDVTALRATGFADTYLTIEDNDTVTGFELSLDPASARESENSVEVNLSVSLLGAFYTIDKTFTATIKDGTANLNTLVNGGDFQLATSQSSAIDIVVPAGQKSASGSFSLILNEDTVNETDETILFEVSQTSGLPAQSTSFTIQDNDSLGSGLDFSIDKTVLMEGQDAISGTEITATASLQNQAVGENPIVVNVIIADGTAKVNTDFTVSPPSSVTVTIPAGQRTGSATFTLKVLDDSIVEPVETITLNTSSDQFTVPNPVIEIHDNESKIMLSLHPTANLVGDGSSIGENAGETAVFVKAAFPDGITFDVPVEVWVTLSAPTGQIHRLSTSDYKGRLSRPFTITIPANSSHGSGRFNIHLFDDDIDEYTEYLNVTGSLKSGKSGVVYSVVSTQLAIVDDDFPVLSFKFSNSFSESSNFQEVSESDGQIVFTVQLKRSPGAPQVAAVVDYTTAEIVGNPSATSGDDYTKTTGRLSFSTNETEKTISVPILEDSEVELAERFKLVLNNPTNAQFPGKVPSISTYGVIREAVAVGNRDIKLQVRKSSGNWSPMISFAESDGSVSMEIQACWPARQVQTNKTVVPVYLWGTNSNAQVSLSGDLDVKLPDKFVQRVFNLLGWQGSRNPVLYVNIPANLRCGTETLRFDIIDDLFHEKTEYLEFSNTRSTPNSVTRIAIQDNDRIAEKILLEVTPSAVDESALLPTTLNVKASWEGGVAHLNDVQITVDVENGTAKSGVDFDFVAGKSSFQLTIPRLVNSATTEFQVKAIPNNLDDGDRIIRFVGRNPQFPGINRSAQGITVESTSIKILDDDDIGDEIVIKLDRDFFVAGQVGEILASVELVGNVVRTTDTEVQVTIAGGTATAGKEYQTYSRSSQIVSSFTLTIPAKTSTSISGKVIEIHTHVVDDMTAGSSRTVVVSGKAEGFNVSPKTVHIFKDLDRSNRYNDYRTLLLSSERSFQESDGDVTVTVNVMWRDGSPKVNDRPFVLAFVSSSRVPLRNNAEYRGGNVDIVNLSKGKQFNLPAGKTGISVDVKLRINDDNTPEFTEYAFLAAIGRSDSTLPLCHSGNTQRTGCIILGGFETIFGIARLTIEDDDAVRLTVDDVVVSEGEPATFTGVLENFNSNQQVIVPWRSGVEGDTAISNVDYEFTEGRWIFSSRQTQNSAVINTIDDSIFEGDENLSLILTNFNESSSEDSFLIELPSENPTGTIKDNDTAGVTVSESGLTVDEGGTGIYTVKLNTKPLGSVTVAVTSGDEAVATASPASLTFSTGNWNAEQTVTVSGVDNDVDGDNPAVAVSHAVTGYGSATASGVTVKVTDDDTAGVTVSESGLTVDEGGTGIYTVKLNTKPLGSVTVAVTSGDEAVATASPASLTFSTGNWNAEQTVTVSGVDNDVDGDNPAVAVSHAVTGYGSATASGVTVKVTDDDTAGVTVSESGLTVDEGGTGIYTVKLNTKPLGSVTVAVTSGDEAVATASPASLTFSTGNWNAEQTVTVSGVDNDVDGDNPAVAVSHAVTGYGSATASGVTVKVTDDDTAGVTVSESGLTVDEGGTGIYTVKLNTKPLGSVTVAVTSGDEAVATASPASLTFSTGNWNAEQTVTVSGVDNDVDGDNPAVAVSHAVTGYGSATASGVTVKVTDDDTAGVTVSESGLTVDEGGTGIYTVKLNTKPLGSVTVAVTSGDEAVATASPASLTFSTGNWNAEQTVTVSGVDNDVDGDNPAVAVSHAVTGYGSATASGVTVKVTDDDTAGVTVSESGLTVDEGGTGIYTVKLNTKPLGSVTVAVTSGDEAVATASPASLTFSTGNWNAEQTVTVSGVDNDVDGDNPAVAVSHAVTGYGSATASGVTVKVTDDDTAGVTVSESGLTVDEGGTGIYTVKLNTKPLGSVTVAVTSGDEAVATASPASLTFSTGNWNAEQTVTVSGVDNDVDGDNPAVAVSHAVTGYGSATASGVTVKVTDDDTAGVTVSESGLTVDEGGTGIYTVKLNTKPLGSVTVAVTSGDEAVATASPASLTFSTGNWNAEQTVTVSGVDNDVDGDNPAVAVSHAVTGYGSATASGVTVKVTDDDTAGVTVSESGLTVDEGGTGIYTVKLNTKPLGSVTVAVTSGDEAVATASPASLTFSTGNWNAEQTVTVSGVDNDVDGDNPAVAVSHAVTGYGSATASGVTVKVTDDDTAGVTVSESGLTVDEGGTGIYTVKLNTKPLGSVTVAVTSGDEAVATASPASLTFSTGNWNAEQTVTVSGVDNDVDGDNPAVAVSHAVTGYGSATASGVTVKVTDDDTAGVTVSESGLTVDEGGTGIYTVKLNTKPLGSVTVAVTSGDEAVATASPASLTFSTGNWNAEQTVTVSGVDNDVDGDNPAVAVSHAVTGYGSATASGVTVKVTDDDTAGVTVSESGLTVDEGGTGIYTVKLNTKPLGSVTVAVTSGDEAVATASPASLTFSTGNWNAEQTVTVSGVDNDVDGDNPAVAVSHAVTGYGSATASGVTVKVTDDDTAGVTVSESGLTVDEGGTGIYTVKLNTKPLGSVTVAVTSGDEAVATASPASLTFSTGNWNAEQTVTVSGVDNDVDGDNPAVAVSHAVTGYGSATASGVTVKVTDDDTAGVTVSESGLTVDEGGTGIYTVKLNTKPLGSVTVAVTSGDEAVATASPASLTFSTGNWNAEQTVTVSGVDNDVDGDNPAVAVSHAVTGYGSATASGVTVKVTDDDTAGVTVSESGLTVDEGGTGIYTVKLNTKPLGSVTVAVTSGDEAVATASPASLTFSTGNWNAEQTVTVSGVDNDVDGDNPAVAVSHAVTGYGSATASGVTVKVTDDDTAGVTVSESGLTVDEGGTGIYTVKLNTKPLGSVTVAVTSGDEAVATASPASLTFSTGNWNAEQTVTVSGVDNDVDGDNPAVAVSHAVTGYGSATASGVTVKVTDDDTAGVTVSESGLTVDEGGTGIYTVKLNTKPLGSVTVAVTSGDEAVATASPASLTFSTGNWNAEQTVTVSGVDNDVDGDNPAVAVSHAVTGYGSATASGVTVKVTDDDTAGVTVSESGLTVDEGGTGIYTVKLNTKPLGSVTVAVTSGDEAVATASPASLTFSTGNWNAEQTVTVSGVDNDVDGDNPAVAVSHAVTGYGSATASGVTVKVTDDDTAGVTVSESGLTVDEGGTGIYTVKLNTKPLGSVTVAVTSGDEAVATASPASLTFSTGNWNAEQTVTVSGVDNDVDGDNPAVAVSHAVTGYGSATASGVTVKVTDDDTAGVTVSESGLTVDEGGTGIYTVKLNTKPLGSVTVAVTSGDEAVATASPASLTFSTGNWNAEQTVTVSGVDNDVDGDNPAVAVSHAVTGYGSATASGVTVKVTDDDTAGVTVSESGLTVDEGGTGIYTVKLNTKPLGSVTVAVTSGDEAVATASPASLTFSTGNWNAEQTVTVSGVDNDVDGDNPAVAVSHAVTGYGSATASGVTVKVTDDDTAGVTVSESGLTVDEGGTGIYTVKLNTKPLGSVTVAVTSGDEAVATASPASLTFSTGNWNAEQTVTVSGVDNDVDGDNPAVAVSHAVTGYGSATASGVTVKVTDDDTAGVTVSESGLTVDEGGTGIYTVKLNTKPLGSVTVAVTSGDEAVATASPASLTFSTGNWNAEQTVTVSGVDNDVDGDNPAVAVSHAVTGYGSATASGVTVKVTDDDTAGVTVSESGLTVDEGGTGIYTVKLNTKPLGSVTVAVTSGDEAVATASPASLTFSTGNWNAEQTVTVSGVDNDVDGDNPAVAVSHAVTGYGSATASGVTVKVTDDDTAGVTVSESGLTVDEGGTGIYTVKLNTKPLGSVTVAVTSGDEAVATASPASLTFSTGNWNAEQTVTVSGVDNDVDGDNPAVAVSHAVTGYGSATASGVTVKVTDDDTAGVTVSESGLTVDEGGTGIYTVKLNTKPLGSVTVAVTSGDEAVATASPASLTFSTGNWNAEQTVTVSGVDNDVDGDNPAVAVSHAVTGYGSATASGVTVKVTDDDTAGVTVSESGLTVDEGGTGIYTVKLNTKPLGSVTVAVTSGDEAVATASPASLTFSTGNWNAEQTVTVSGVDNDVDGDNPAVAVSHAVTGYGSATASGVTVKVTDDDTAGVTVSESGLTVDEGGTGIYTVKLNTKPLGSVTVAVTSGDEAVATASPASLTFSTGNWNAEQTVTVSGVDNDVDGDNPAVAVSHAVTGYGSATASGVTVKVTDDDTAGVTVSESGLTVDEGGTGIYTVKLNTKPLGSVTVAVTSGDEAVATASPASLTFSTGNWNAEQTVTVSGVDNDVDGDNPAVAVSHAVTGYGSATASGVTVKVTDDDTAGVTVSESGLTVDEGGTGIYTVKLNTKPLGSVTVAVTSGDEAVATASPASLTFSTGNWNAEQTVTVSGVDNDVDGDNPAVAVSHAVTGYGSATASGVTVKVTDDDTAGVTVSESGLTVDEGGTGIYTVKLNTKPLGSVTVAVTSGDEAVATASPASLTFSTGNWNAEQTVTVSGVDNDVDGDNPAVAVSHAVTGYGSATASGVTVKVTDDDTAGVTVSESGLTVDEGGTGIYTVKLNTKPLGSVTVAVTSGDEAVATASPASLTFSTGNWNAEQTVTVSGVDNDVDGDNPAVAVSHAVTGYGSATASGVTVKVTDDDTAGVTVSESGLTVDEGGTGIYTVKLNTKPLGSVTVAVTSGDEAVATASPASLTFSTGNWNAEQTVTVSGVDNDVDGDNPAVAVSHAVTGYGSATASGVTVKVTDDDTAGVTVSESGLTVDEGGTGIYTVKLNTKPLGSVTVAVTSGDEAVATASPASLTFSTGNWNAEQTVTVSGVDNDVDGDNPAVAVSHAVTGYGSATASGVTVKVTDDDTAGVTVSESGLTVDEGGTGIYTVKLNTKPLGSVTVAVTSGDEAVATASPASLTFSTGNWNAEQTVTVSGVDNDVDGDNPAVAVSHAVTGYGSATASGVTVKVTDDDTAGVTVSESGLTVDEGGTGIYTVKLNTKPLGSVTVAVTSGDEAVATASPASLTFSTGNWNAEQTVTVSGVDNDVDGDNPAVAVSHAVTGYGSATASGVTVKVTDDDTAGVTVSESGLTVDEGGTGIYTVKLNTKPLGSVTVAVTSGDEAVATASPASLTFSTGNWNAEQTVTVSGVDNDVDGDNPAVAVSHAVTGYGSATASGVTVKVTDDDTAGVTVSESGLTVDEGGTGIYTVKLNTKPLGSVTVAVTSGDEAVATASPASLTFSTGNWNAEQTVTVSGVDNDVDGDNPAVAVSHAVTGYGSATASGVTVKVTDDDTAGVTVSESGLTVDEGGTGIYTVKLNTKPLGSVTVAVTSGDEAVATASPASLTFSTGNWNAEQTVTVSGVDNDVDGDNPAVAVSHAVTGYGSATASGVTVKVTDDDTAGVTVSESGLTVDEGGTGIYTVKLNTKPLGSVTVAVTSGDEAVATASPASLTFSTGNWNAEQTVTVSGVDNDVDGDNPAVAVSHAVTGYGSATASGVTVKVTDDDTAGVTVSESGLTVDEGGTGIYTVKLNTKPLGSVTVAVTSGDEAVATASPASLTFSTGNWNAEQTVTVSGVDNDVDGDNPAVAVSHAVTGYGSATASGVTVKVTDDDTAGVTVSESGLTVDEGGTGIYTVKLNTKPLGSVTVAVTSGDEAVATASPASLTFSTGNWNAEQTVTVSGVDNDVDGDNPAVAVSHAVTGYGSATASGVTVKVTDDDTAGVTVSESGLTVDEGGTGIYTVKLNTKPLGSVTVAVTSGDEAVATASPASLTFSTGNWNAEQTVTVSGVDNDVDGDNPAVAVSHAVTGYGSATASGVTVKVTDDDTEEDSMLSMPTVLTVTEGTDEFAMVRPTVSAAVGQEIALNVAYGGTATGMGGLSLSGDYVNDITTSITLGSSDTGLDIMVPIMDDRLDEPDETIAVMISAASTLPANFALGNAMTMVTIVDNDSSPVLADIADRTIKLGQEVDITAQATDADGDEVVYTWTRIRSEIIPTLPDNTALNAAQLNFTPLGTGVYSMTVTASDGINTDTKKVVITVQNVIPPGVTLSKLNMTLKEGTSDSYTVVLDAPPTDNVIIIVGGVSGDISVSSNRLTFTTANWNTAQTIKVIAAKDTDSNQDPDVTLTHSALGGGYGNVQVDSVVVQIIDTTETEQTERINKINSAILPYLVDTISSADAIRERVEAAAVADSTAKLQFGAISTSNSLKSRSKQWDNTQLSQPDLLELLNGAAFNLPIEDFGSEKDAAAVWGRSELVNLSGSRNNVFWTGDLWSAHLGADVRLDSDFMAGAAVSLFNGDFNSNINNMKSDYEYEAELTLVRPYAAWLSEDGSNVWSTVGYGKGKIGINVEGITPRRTTDLMIANTTLGGRSMLITDSNIIKGGLTRIAIRGEGTYAWGETKTRDGIEALKVNSRRLRLLLQGSHERELLSSAQLKSTMEMGLRYDEGDVVAGTSLEAGVHLSYQKLPSRITLEIHARGLINNDSNREEWGVGGRVQLDPATDGSGLFFTLVPTYGNTTSNLDQLFDYTISSSNNLESGLNQKLHLDAELGYGYSVPGYESQAVLSPYAGFSLISKSAQTIRFGVRYNQKQTFSMSVEAERQSALTSSAEYGIMLRGALKW